MKKSIGFAAILLIGIGFNALAGGTPACFVKAGDKTYFGEKLKTGLLNYKIIADDGSVVKVPISKVNSYQDRSGYFELLPLVNEAYDTTAYVMMQYVASKNGLRLFAYPNPSLEEPGKELYVFSSDGFYLKINRRNAPTALTVFGVKAK